IDDREGQHVYLGNLLEAHRYLGEIPEAIAVGEELIALLEQHRLDSSAIRKSVERLRRGEPLLRVVCVAADGERELDELRGASAGHYQYEFRRNRCSL